MCTLQVCISQWLTEYGHGEAQRISITFNCCWERERGRGRKYWLGVSPIHEFIGWSLYVPWPGVKLEPWCVCITWKPQSYLARGPSFLDLYYQTSNLLHFPLLILSSLCLNLKVFCDTCFSIISYTQQSVVLLFTGSHFVLGLCIAYYLPFPTLVSFLQIHPAFDCQIIFLKLFWTHCY